jgi:hypothetical protein
MKYPNIYRIFFGFMADNKHGYKWTLSIDYVKIPTGCLEGSGAGGRAVEALYY